MYFKRVKSFVYLVIDLKNWVVPAHTWTNTIDYLRNDHTPTCTLKQYIMPMVIICCHGILLRSAKSHNTIMREVTQIKRSYEQSMSMLLVREFLCARFFIRVIIAWNVTISIFSFGGRNIRRNVYHLKRAAVNSNAFVWYVYE